MLRTQTNYSTRTHEERAWSVPPQEHLLNLNTPLDLTPISDLRKATYILLTLTVLIIAAKLWRKVKIITEERAAAVTSEA